MSFAWRARVAVEVRYGWLCVVGVSGANAPVNAQPHQKIAAMLGRPGHSTAWCVDGGQCPRSRTAAVFFERLTYVRYRG